MLTARSALAREQDAPHDTLFAASLLRTGSAREAILVLQAARKKLGPDAPPIEELLLALAHAKRKQFHESNKHHKAAVAWMQRGPQAVQAASLVGLACRGPFASLPGLANKPPDPLVSIHWTISRHTN